MRSAPESLTLVASTANGVDVPATSGAAGVTAATSATSASHRRSGVLAFTGSNMRRALVSAILALVVGLMPLVVSRRRDVKAARASAPGLRWTDREAPASRADRHF